MNTPEATRQPWRPGTVRPLLRRLFWLAVVCFHVGAIPSLVANALSDDMAARSDAVLRGISLALAALFCGLKVLDVSCLRLRSGWRSTVAASLVIALLHVNVIERASGETAFSPAHLGVFLFAGALLESDSTGKALKRLVNWGRRKNQRHKLTHVHLDCFLRAREAAFRPVPLRVAARPAPPRAPPA